ncbi:hypothetical protein F5X68DRAFT_80665 [Plectosphaerella plurivora]|uniref:Uncharacterized protein n=1 Tax=Plectosphaerella plurivora TaxID=936078 RepID=A0A9P8VC57_9PEZI|nr:hypothetical protein F5X68DRAFT_80665 [Plectosphaerella plurivora]
MGWADGRMQGPLPVPESTGAVKNGRLLPAAWSEPSQNAHNLFQPPPSQSLPFPSLSLISTLTSTVATAAWTVLLVSRLAMPGPSAGGPRGPFFPDLAFSSSGHYVIAEPPASSATLNRLRFWTVTGDPAQNDNDILSRDSPFCGPSEQS